MNHRGFKIRFTAIAVFSYRTAEAVCGWSEENGGIDPQSDRVLENVGKGETRVGNAERVASAAWHPRRHRKKISRLPRYLTMNGAFPARRDGAEM